MADQPELVTVFRSAEPSARREAEQIHNVLVEAGLHSSMFDDSTPGVVVGTWEVRVPEAETASAEQVLAAHAGAEQDEEDQGGRVDPSRQLDTESVYQSLGTNAEMEAMAIQGLLQSNGIDAIVVGDSILPQFGFEVRVARELLEQARELIAKAEAEGPQAASEEAEEPAPEV